MWWDHDDVRNPSYAPPPQHGYYPRDGGANEPGWWTQYAPQQQQQHARLPDAAAVGPPTVFSLPPPPWDPLAAALTSSAHRGTRVPADAAQERHLPGPATAGTTRSTPVSSSMGALPSTVGPLGPFGYDCFS
ncbi:hypothetical protein GGF32_003321 [Allomyces javanicus]|nr:hypothetical protein GGF32_003321 [Allomyces javanicus]